MKPGPLSGLSGGPPSGHPLRAPPPRATPLLWIAPWLGLALLASINTLTYWRLSGWDHPAWRAFAAQAPGWLAAGALTPLVLGLGRRFRLRRRSLLRVLPIHLAGALLLNAVFAATMTAATLHFSPVATDFTTQRILLNWFLSGLAPMTLAYFGILGAGYALDYSRRYREGELHAARLNGQLAEARLGRLEAQLHPHFLFNSLNAITVLLRDGDSRAATHMLELLSDIMRRMLRSETRHELQLGEELDVMRQYLAIEQVRFSDRLRVTIDVDDDALDVAVPSFVLQPLIENALRHGIAPSAAAGRLRISARRIDDHIELRVTDDGPGLAPAWRAGLGLSNTAARLATLYGDAATLNVTAADTSGTGDTGGTSATIRLPARTLENTTTERTHA